MHDEPHSMIFGWTLDDIGPILANHIGEEYDENWRHPDSKSTWHLRLKEWLHGPSNSEAELWISFGDGDWGEIADGRYILGAALDCRTINGFEEFTGLQQFRDYAAQNNIELPPIQHFFYYGDQSYGWAVDTGEWFNFKKRIDSKTND